MFVGATLGAHGDLIVSVSRLNHSGTRTLSQPIHSKETVGDSGGSGGRGWTLIHTVCVWAGPADAIHNDGALSGSDKGRACLLASLSGDGRAGPADAIHNNGTLSGSDKDWAGSDAIHNNGTPGGSGLWRPLRKKLCAGVREIIMPYASPRIIMERLTTARVRLKDTFYIRVYTIIIQ